MPGDETGGPEGGPEGGPAEGGPKEEGGGTKEGAPEKTNDDNHSTDENSGQDSKADSSKERSRPGRDDSKSTDGNYRGETGKPEKTNDTTRDGTTGDDSKAGNADTSNKEREEKERTQTERQAAPSQGVPTTSKDENGNTGTPDGKPVTPEATPGPGAAPSAAPPMLDNQQNLTPAYKEFVKSQTDAKVTADTDTHFEATYRDGNRTCSFSYTREGPNSVHIETKSTGPMNDSPTNDKPASPGKSNSWSPGANFGAGQPVNLFPESTDRGYSPAPTQMSSSGWGNSPNVQPQSNPGTNAPPQSPDDKSQPQPQSEKQPDSGNKQGSRTKEPSTKDSDQTQGPKSHENRPEHTFKDGAPKQPPPQKTDNQPAQTPPWARHLIEGTVGLSLPEIPGVLALLGMEALEGTALFLGVGAFGTATALAAIAIGAGQLAAGSAAPNTDAAEKFFGPVGFVVGALDAVSGDAVSNALEAETQKLLGVTITASDIDKAISWQETLVSESIINAIDSVLNPPTQPNASDPKQQFIDMYFR